MKKKTIYSKIKTAFQKKVLKYNYNFFIEYFQANFRRKKKKNFTKLLMRLTCQSRIISNLINDIKYSCREENDFVDSNV